MYNSNVLWIPFVWNPQINIFPKIDFPCNLQANTFFCRQHFSSKKLADDKNFSSYVSQGDGGLKKNNQYLMKLVRE
jgi:hypothetical protein